MATFQYTAKDINGRTVVGVIDAPSETEAANILHNKMLVVVAVNQVKAKGGIFTASKGKVKLDDLVIFSRQLATMIDAGIPLVQALGILSEQVDNKVLQGIVMTVRQDIEAGMSFCDALSKHPQVFS
ncbi:MAG: type II secretion system F family protein, partial [Candidatus Omnitrophica bacterium]|nr:type II secretion system F family protein [Candidatus Omnitrophota bacterium]